MFPRCPRKFEVGPTRKMEQFFLMVIQLDKFRVCMLFPLPEDFMICSGNAHWPTEF
jgi:hypothetical protein